MAAGILLGIMILSLMVYIFSIFGNYAKQQDESLGKKNLEEFNSQFTKYEASKEITAHDIVTIANLAKDINTQEDGYEKIVVSVTGTGLSPSLTTNMQNLTETQLNSFIESQSLKDVGGKKEIIYFQCQKITFSSSSGRVKSIQFARL